VVVLVEILLVVAVLVVEVLAHLETIMAQTALEIQAVAAVEQETAILLQLLATAALAS
jgi:hypothetical protein